MRYLIMFCLFALCATVSVQAQTFNFTPTASASSAPVPTEDDIAITLEMYDWLSYDPANAETLTIAGTDYPVLRHNDNRPVVCLKAKYVVYLDSTDSPGTITWNDGIEYPAYPAGGKYVIFLPSKRGGYYGKYVDVPAPAEQ